jgi:hypothetical protein
MFLTRLKLVAAVVLVLGLAGGGAGWLALRPAGAEPPPARAVEQPKPPTLTGQVPKASAPADDPVQRVRAELRKAQAESDALEAAQLEEIVQARLRLAEAEMSVHEKEREHAVRREQETARWKTLLAQSKQVQADVDRVKATMSMERNNTAILNVFKSRLLEIEEQLKKEEAEARKREQSRARELLDRRKQLISAEEKLRFLERRQARQRERARAQEDEAEERLRQLRGGLPHSELGDRRLRALEQKVDRMLGELADLRRDLGRRSGGREE